VNLPVRPYVALDEDMPGQHIVRGVNHKKHLEYYARCTAPIRKRSGVEMSFMYFMEDEYVLTGAEFVWRDNPDYKNLSFSTRLLYGFNLIFDAIVQFAISITLIPIKIMDTVWD